VASRINGILFEFIPTAGAPDILLVGNRRRTGAWRFSLKVVGSSIDPIENPGPFTHSALESRRVPGSIKYDIVGEGYGCSAEQQRAVDQG